MSRQIENDDINLKFYPPIDKQYIFIEGGTGSSKLFSSKKAYYSVVTYLPGRAVSKCPPQVEKFFKPELVSEFVVYMHCGWQEEGQVLESHPHGPVT